MSTSSNPQNPAGPVKTLSIVSISSGGAGFLLSLVPCCGIFLLGGVLGVAAVVTGVFSLTKLKNLAAPETAGPSKGLAIGGIVLGGLAMAIVVLWILFLIVAVATGPH